MPEGYLVAEAVPFLVSTLCMIVMNLIGNTLLVAARLYSTNCNYPLGTLIVHLALCDLTAVISLFQILLDITIDLGYIDATYIQQSVCNVSAYGAYVYIMGQAFTVCKIAICRYLKITDLRLYSAYISKKGHIWSMIMMWIVVGLFFFALPSLIFGPMHRSVNNRPITGVQKMGNMSSSEIAMNT